MGSGLRFSDGEWHVLKGLCDEGPAAPLRAHALVELASGGQRWNLNTRYVESLSSHVKPDPAVRAGRFSPATS